MNSTAIIKQKDNREIPIRILLRDKHGNIEDHTIYAMYGECLLNAISRNFNVKVKSNELGTWITAISGQKVRIYEDVQGGIQGYVNNTLPYVIANSNPMFLGFHNIAVTSEFELRMQYDPYLQDIRVPLSLKVKVMLADVFGPNKGGEELFSSCSAAIDDAMRKKMNSMFASHEIMYFTVDPPAKEGIAFTSICCNMLPLYKHEQKSIEPKWQGAPETRLHVALENVGGNECMVAVYHGECNKEGAHITQITENRSSEGSIAVVYPASGNGKYIQASNESTHITQITGNRSSEESIAVVYPASGNRKYIQASNESAHITQITGNRSSEESIAVAYPISEDRTYIQASNESVHITQITGNRSSEESIAVVYPASGNRKYIQTGAGRVRQIIPEEKICEAPVNVNVELLHASSASRLYKVRNKGSIQSSRKLNVSAEISGLRDVPKVGFIKKERMKSCGKLPTTEKNGKQKIRKGRGCNYVRRISSTAQNTSRKMQSKEVADKILKSSHQQENEKGKMKPKNSNQKDIAELIFSFDDARRSRLRKTSTNGGSILHLLRRAIGKILRRS